MNLRIPMEIDVLWNSPEACDLNELGIDHNLDPEIRKMTLYNVVSCVAYYKDGKRDHEMVCINDGYEPYIIDMTYQEALNYISQYL